MIAELAVRSYRTLRSRGKANDAQMAMDRAVRKLEWRYKLFWTRGSFRFGDCC